MDFGGFMGTIVASSGIACNHGAEKLSLRAWKGELAFEERLVLQIRHALNAHLM